MSHPVFLNSAPHKRMPDGSKNEWKDFWGDGPELEANAALPLLWMALFRPSDIAWARLVDDEDIESGGREEMEEFGDVTYPYLVASVEEALATFHARRPMLASLLGERLAPIVDEFAAYIRQRYAPFVLLRTSGLPDAEDNGPALQQALEELDALQPGVVADDKNFAAAEVAMVHRYGNIDPVQLLSGSDGVTWPSASLKQRFQPSISGPATPSGSKERGRRSFRNAVMGWLPALVIGAATVATYAYTNSAWAAGGCFVVVCLAFIWGMR